MVTAALVKELREKTGAGMMDCKKVLTETDGDLEKAAELLREKGITKAAKKSGRVAAEGMVDEYISKSPAFDQNAFNECLEGFYKSKERFKKEHERFKAEWPDQKAWERELKRRIEEKVNRDFDKKLEAERAAKEACKPKCPYCKSTKVKKIGVSGRLFSTAMFGMASGKIGKQWHCNNCKSDF